MIQFVLLFALLFTANAARDKLEIYVFDVGQADSQLIVFPSGYSILIDLGEEGGSGGSTNAKYVGKRIEKILGKKSIDVFVLTHYHIDHHGGYKKGGIWYLVEKMGFKIGKFVDRNIGTYKGSKLSKCNKDTITWKYVGQTSGGTDDIVCYTSSSKEKTKLSKIREFAHRCSKTQIAPKDSGAEVQIIIRDAFGVKDSKGTKLNSKKTMGKAKPTAENDFSIGLKVTYGKFVYVTCGDLSGKEDETDNFIYHDVETTVAPMVGEVDVYHVNHHGSYSASNKNWLNTLKPTVSVISCKKNRPNPNVMKRITKTGSVVYTTNNCWKSSGDTNPCADKTIMYNGDVVIKVGKDDTTFTVSKKDGSSKKTYNIKANKKAGKCQVLE